MSVLARNTTQNALALSTLTVLATVIASGATHAACQRPDGKDLSGEYVSRQLLEEQPVGHINGGAVLTLKQDGCTLTIDTVNKWNDYTYNVRTGQLTSRIKSNSGGRYVLDLTGTKPAKLPAQYIKANSNDPASTKMTESLEVYTTLNKDGDLDIAAEFDVTHAGVTIRMRATSTYHFSFGNYSIGSSNPKAAPKPTMSGALYVAYPGVKFEVIPNARLEAEQGAKHLAIRTSANWFLEFAQPFISNAVRVSDVSFFRK